MARTRLDEAGGLSVAEVTHSKFSALPADATVGQVREWFAGSESRRMALLADDGRFAGHLVPEDVPESADPERPAADLARLEPTVAPDDPATRGEELALGTPARRVPVVDRDGRLLGIVAVTTDLQGFCGTGGSGGC
jgi:CBS domain-containing protein